MDDLANLAHSDEACPEFKPSRGSTKTETDSHRGPCLCWPNLPVSLWLDYIDAAFITSFLNRAWKMHILAFRSGVCSSLRIVLMSFVVHDCLFCLWGCVREVSLLLTPLLHTVHYISLELFNMTLNRQIDPDFAIRSRTLSEFSITPNGNRSLALLPLSSSYSFVRSRYPAKKDFFSYEAILGVTQSSCSMSTFFRLSSWKRSMDDCNPTLNLQRRMGRLLHKKSIFCTVLWVAAWRQLIIRIWQGEDHFSLRTNVAFVFHFSTLLFIVLFDVLSIFRGFENHSHYSMHV